MSEQITGRGRLIKNILIAAVAGIAAGLLIGTVNRFFADMIPRSVVLGGVGATIGAVFIMLQTFGKKHE